MLTRYGKICIQVVFKLETTCYVVHSPHQLCELSCDLDLLKFKGKNAMDLSKGGKFDLSTFKVT